MSGRVRMKTVALPAEHGGWGFLFEPILLGLLVAPSLAGVSFGIMAVASFLLRHPLRLCITGTGSLSESPRRRAAMQVAIVYAAIAVAGLVGGVSFGGIAPLMPLAVLSPFVAVYLFYDTRKRARRLLPELAGPIGLAGVATAIALAGGWLWLQASALWIVLMARTIPSIFYVRARLRLERGEGVNRIPTVGYHLGFGVLVIVLSLKDLAPYLTVIAMLLLLSRALHGLSPRRRPSKATRIGFLEIGYGLVYVFLTILGYRIGV